ncbi:nucleotidyltransferase family protein [Rhodopseudomonas palustris]|uniref:nucleotidyltransferase family protein n=1 Tax=Rhodopseudomonas palustris TaxID=1076 RepID=UPI002ACDA25F|nr:nucleotidyltransferase family protein [Rhodopseudomonas palustris]WQG97556.1 nucleotidyltransferase family protein [Rhodopseudomonas palustris]
MASFSHALLPLCDCLKGKVPQRADWTAIVGLANHTLTTPSLIGFVTAQRSAIPDEVAAYVHALHERNAIRNNRLSDQLEEAVVALNGAGIKPLLLKGAAMLATIPPTDRARRLMSDLDLVVRPDEIDAAMKALASIGYNVDYEADGQQKKWYADLKRPADVGMIDLHREFPGQSFLDQTTADLRSHLRASRLGAANALVPSPELQALIFVMHDQFQDHDYWTGSIDLRHLLDLRTLIAAPGGVQWDGLMTMVSGTLARNAVETQLMLLTTLFDLPWPDHYPKRLVPRVQVWRQLLQARFPQIRYFLLPIGLLDYRSHRRAATGKQPSGDRKRRWLPRLGTLRFLMSLSYGDRAGKI